MKTITLQILAEDIKTSDYTNVKDCAITRALKRAGVNAYERGFEIDHNEIKGEESYITTPKDLKKKVLGMYAFVDKEEYISPEKKAYMWSYSPEIEPKDFEFELQVPDHW